MSQEQVESNGYIHIRFWKIQTGKVLWKHFSREPDGDKYTVALNILNEAIISKRYDNILKNVFKPLSNYNIIIVPRPTKQDAEFIYKIISLVKGWENPDIKPLSTIIRENPHVLQAYGLTPEALISASTTPVQTETNVEKYTSISGGLKVGFPQVSVNAGGKHVEKIERKMDVQYTSNNVTAALIDILCEANLKRPTILTLHEKEMEIYDMSIIAESSSLNRNLVVLLWLPSNVSEGFLKLLTQKDSWSTMLPKSEYTKSYLINMYIAMSNDFIRSMELPLLRKETSKVKTNVGYTIKLLVETGILQDTIEKFMNRLVDPVLVIDATNRFIAKMYAIISTSPKEILNYRASRPKEVREKVIDAEIKNVANTLIKETENEIISDYYGQDGLNKIYEVVKKLGNKEKLEDALKQRFYPSYTSNNTIIEALIKLGVLAITKKTGKAQKITGGVVALYKIVKETKENNTS